ncbi:hypothetical protein [Novipirellula artificiosorum]|uniref:Uncharacterized protein n=1 Tax=Novipirellula artificiosorum TaxID=2528016 RepID=A0A5C6DU09_9BACT|nr:hypothetical protein [Novipirellula artificiosorum]TWU39775.1 hypothetical protein Poly41_26310 [Novipirellula artificiosorum]
MSASVKSPRWRPAIFILLSAIATVSFAVERPWHTYQKQSTWAQTVVTARTAFEHPDSIQGLRFGNWHQSRPVNSTTESNQPYLTQLNDFDAKATDPSGEALWTEQRKWETGKHISFSLQDDHSYYLTRVITADRDCEIAIDLSHDDGLVLWLNGDQLLDSETVLNIKGDSPVEQLRLRRGQNVLVLKVYNVRGQAGFCLACKGDLVDADWSWKQIRNDFPGISHRFETEFPKTKNLASWFAASPRSTNERGFLRHHLDELQPFQQTLQTSYSELIDNKVPQSDPRWLALYEQVVDYLDDVTEFRRINLPAWSVLL